LGLVACGDKIVPPDNTSLPAAITAMQAYYCANPATTCADRGNLIPSGTLPPTNQSFMVWSWQPGTNQMELCVITPVHQGCAPQYTSPDSVGFPVTVTGNDHTYVLRMRIVGLNNATVSVDSLIYQYP
jgi:hypothetical protein